MTENYLNDLRIIEAIKFATEAHLGQERGFGVGEAYIEHPKRVAARIARLGLSTEAIQAALLHDVVEDCDVTSEDIYRFFGPLVGKYVAIMTDIPYVKDGPNRAARKDATRIKFLTTQGLDAIVVGSIKVADCVDNATGIRDNDPNFWKVFKKEVLRLSQVITMAEPNMHDELRDILGEPHKKHDSSTLSVWENGKLRG